MEPLERLALLRCFRCDRVCSAARMYVSGLLGEKFVQPPVLDYRRVYAQSSPTCPLVFVLSPGADPQAAIQQFSSDMNMGGRFKVVALEEYPNTSSPAVLGLHCNAEIEYYTAAAKDLWANLLLLQPRRAVAAVSSSGGPSRESGLAAVAEALRAKIPLESADVGSFDLARVRVQLLAQTRSAELTPCQVVLMQELERWNALVCRMFLTLSDLLRGLRGEIGMSAELETLSEALANGVLPAAWRRLAPSTQKSLGSWMAHFARRHAQYATWIERGEPSVVWLAGLHVPESYLIALVQTTSRRRGWPLDASTWRTTVTQYSARDAADSLPPLEPGECYLTGLYLEGAAWDTAGSALQVQRPKVLVEELPLLRVTPIESSRHKQSHGTIRTPVYVTQNRSDAAGSGLVFEVDLATHEHPSHWVLQGVAVMLNIDT